MFTVCTNRSTIISISKRCIEVFRQARDMMLLSQVSFKRTGLIEVSMGFWASQGDLSRQRCLWGVFMNGVQTSGLGCVGSAMVWQSSAHEIVSYGGSAH